MNLQYRTLVGHNSNTNITEKPWFKVASVTLSENFDDADLVMYVKSTYNTYPFDGILRVHLRSSNIGCFESGKCYWIIRKGIALNDFVLAYNTNTNPTIGELWVKNTTAWMGIQFDVISYGDRLSFNQKWSFTKEGLTNGGYASITSGYSQIVSSDVS